MKEMLEEEFGEVTEAEIREAVTSGEIIESYPKDRPVPSCLIYGNTKKRRPLHIVCAPLLGEETLVIITVYEPDPDKWINFKRRKK
ncbi:MAG: DUF4258 domain-containing protein [Deltaproteobacteria bacterium]|nr:DUF4258 domain-containing protein [Deltaproteobacteria bacterium]